MNRNEDVAGSADSPERLTPVEVIRQKCIDCSGGSHLEVRLCQVLDCACWAWRMGKRPETVKEHDPKLLDPEYIRREGEKRSR